MNQETKHKRLRPQPVPVVNNRFAAALGRFGAALLETSAVLHTGIKGTKREDAFRDFIGERLPKRFDVATGEIVDQFNTAGPQLDVLIFDQTRNFSFSDGDVHVLPAEALLASVEVKSRLDAGQVTRACEVARKLRMLRPFKARLGGRDLAVVQGQGKHARYLHCVFAYESDLAEGNWLMSEAQRFRRCQTKSEHLIDSVYVLRRGLLNLNSGKGRVEDNNGSAITSFYFSILNFIERENGRRPDTPYQEYASLLSGKWESLGD